MRVRWARWWVVRVRGGVRVEVILLEGGLEGLAIVAGSGGLG